jgi:hypothetical protein
MGLLGNFERRSVVGVGILIGLFTVLDYAFHVVFPKFMIPESLVYSYFGYKLIFGFIVLYLILRYGSRFGVVNDLQIAALFAIILSLRYFVQGSFPLDVQAGFAIAHFVVGLLSLKLYEVVA